MSDPTLITVRNPAAPVELTDREATVLRGMANGLLNGAIGRELYLTEDTVKTYARGLFRKLGATGRAHAVALAFARGMLAADPTTFEMRVLVRDVPTTVDTVTGPARAGVGA